MNNDADADRTEGSPAEAYDRAIQHRQRGEWHEALAVLSELQAGAPDNPDLAALIEDTQLRLESAQKWPALGRRLIGPSRRALFSVILLMLLVIFGIGVSVLYRGVIAPSLAQMRVEQQQAQLAERAQNALTSGAFEEALTLYDQLAAEAPDHPDLAAGRARAQEALELDATYRRAQAQLAAGQLAEAQATLIGIQRIAPKYRDTAVLLAGIERQQQVASLLYAASEGKAAGDLEGVIVRLEAARLLVQGDERKALEAQLFDAYLTRAHELVTSSGGGVGELTLAFNFYNKALALRPGTAAASTQRAHISQYLAGYDAFTAASWEPAIAALEPLYGVEPGYLNGQAARLLYDAYVHTANALLDEGSTARAWEIFNRAAQLAGVDVSGARALAASLALLLTPTPTPEPTATLTPEATATLQPTATATPRYVALSQYRGKIAFFSNRGGEVELWIMDPDGHHAFRPWHQDKLREEYQKMRELERRSPDGAASVVVTTPRSQKNPQIFILQPDGKLTRITDWGGEQYDPVWSPKGHWIAFVSNEPGNDEIFMIGDDGQFPKRITWNDWEWDKHPSWAPEGGRLVFWSNRDTGYGQIWLTNDDGTGQVNLSNNKFEETDPLWIK